MKLLPIKILTALITFTLGVAIASLWLSSWVAPGSSIDPIALSTPATRLEMVFVLDTTGSMSGLLEGAKQRIWGIVNQVMQESDAQTVRIGLVAYRDRGDEYLTQVQPLTEDLDTIYTTLMNYHAQGGGDFQEDVRTALAAGLNNAGWSPAASDLSQVIFLVGDAPPHDDYDDAIDTLVTASSAVQRGIIVNTVRCGLSAETERVWQAIARQGNGQYFSIAQNGGVQAISTPYDEEMSQLGNRLGSTFVPFGFGAGGAAQRAAVAAEKASVEEHVERGAPSVAKAERAYNKAISSKAYIGDLLQSIENGSVKLESVDPADLPSDLQSLSLDERRAEIEKRLAARRDIRSKIKSLSQQRQAFIEEQKKGQAKKDGFDEVVTKTLKEQMARKKK